MKNKIKNPRVLIVTPEVSYVPEAMRIGSNGRMARAGGLGDMSAALIQSLYHQGVDIHLALPDYRTIFSAQQASHPIQDKPVFTQRPAPPGRVHLARDQAFHNLKQVYSPSSLENIDMSIAFQREVINHIIPLVKPDLIHCNDWMTSLIPAMARELKIPCLFSIHNIHTVHTLLAQIEDSGVDGRAFWQNLYYSSYPGNYEETRNRIPLDFLVSGIFAAHFVNTVSPTFLDEIIARRHDFISAALSGALANKQAEGCAVGILNAPDPSYDPATDKALFCTYTAANHMDGKKSNKCGLQEKLGLMIDSEAPLFFWPSRLDTIQKGCELLSEILYAVVSRYWEQHLQIVFVADGSYQKHFQDIVRQHDLSARVAVRGFHEQLSRRAFGASDFVIMPSRFEPCGLPQMIGARYGALPIVRDTGGLHDTVTLLDVVNNRGNGFLFKAYDADGLSWAIDQGMNFFRLPVAAKNRQIGRIMQESRKRFCHDTTAAQYIALYERMLNRPLVYQEKVAKQKGARQKSKDFQQEVKESLQRQDSGMVKFR